MQEGTAILLKNLPGGRQEHVAAGQSRPRLMLCFLIDDSFSPVTSPVLVTVIDILARHGFQVETVIAEEVVTQPESLGSTHDLYIMESNTELSLSLAGILHTQGARMLNPYMSCITTQDKIVASQLLHATGVPVPSSWVTRNLTLLWHIVEQTPLVIKPHRGHRGVGMRLVQNANELSLIPPPRTPVLIQKFVQGNGQHLKIYVVNEEVFAVRKRVPPLGFIPQREMPSQPGEPCEVSSELRDIALRCGRILGLGLYGLDVIETSEGPFVVDVDSFPSYQGVPNIAPLIAEYIKGYALGWFNLEPLGLNAQAETELAEKETKDSGTAVEEAIFLTEFLQTSATIRRYPEKGADSAANTTTQEAQPVRNHYAHTMPEHAPDIRDEGKRQPSTEASNQPEGAKSRRRRGVVYERQRAGGEQGRKPDIRASREGLAPTYEVVNTLKQAAEKTGIPLDEILTTRDIQDEWNVNRHRIHEWTRRGPHGEPHLSPLPVRLKAAGGGQLLFRRGDVESKISNPPKPGRPWR